MSTINGFDDILDVNNFFKDSNISKGLANNLLKESKFADDLDKPYTKTAKAAKEASSAIEEVGDAASKSSSAVTTVSTTSSSVVSAVEDIEGATEASSQSMTAMETATAGLAAEEATATGVTVSFGTALKGFLISVAPILAITAAVAGVAFAFKKANDHIKKFDTSLEKAQTAQSSFEQTKSELSSLQDELSVTKDKIKELNNKDKLTFTEKTELDNLKSQSKELQLQIDLKNKLANTESKKAVKESMTALEQNHFIDHTSKKEISSNGRGDVDGVKRTVYKRTDLITAAQNEVDKLNKLKNKREKLLNDYDSAKTKKSKNSIQDELNKNSKSIDKWENTVSNKIKKLQKLRDNFLDENDNLKSDLNSKQQSMYNNLTKVLDDYTNNDPVAKKAAALERIWDNKDFAKAQQSLVDKIRQGQDVSVDSLKKDFPELVSACDKAGISVSDLKNELDALGQSSSGVTKLENDFEEFQTTAVGAINSVDALNAALANNVSGKGLGIELDDEGNITGDLVDIKSAFSSLDGYDPSVLFEKTANGVHLNAKALRELQAQQEALQKNKFLEQEKTLQEQLNTAIIEQKKYAEGSDDYMVATAQVNSLKEQLESQAKEEYYSYDRKIREQSNDVNALDAQIQALSGVNDAATQSRLKKLMQQRKEAQQTLDDTKRDHRNDLISKGYDQMSQDLSDLLEDTEYEISHNADKQNEIIQSMLNKQVGMYQEAYNKINSIIKNTGWVGSNGFNNNQSQMSSQKGAQNQASNASQSQQTANSKPSSSASGTNTSGIKDNASENNKITENIMKPENTTNRPVAELTVSKSSVSIEEGKSTSVTTKIRPNDAANKTLSWKSSNESVATVSNGTISGKKPGSCQITVSTTDGSGISKTIAVTVTKKPDPPKPATPSNKGGDGVPRVGDVVTFTGKYYYDSWGKRPAGSLYSGVKNGVVIDSYSSRDYGGSARYTGDLKVHIKSRDGRYGNLGWVRLSQISGYAKGTPGVDKDQIAIVDEEGRELQIPNGKGGRITKLEKGTGVIPHTATEKLMALSEQLDNNGNMVINGRSINEYVNDMANMQSIAVPDFSDVTASVVSQLDGKSMGNVTVEYNQPVTFNSVDKNDIPQMEEFLKRAREDTTKYIVKELRKGGMQIRR